VSADTVGTVVKVYPYTYDLYGLPQADGSLLVKYGKWTGEAIRTHPDYLIGLPPEGQPIAHASMNKSLDLSVISEIFARLGLGRRTSEPSGSR
jgi:hypothetical protein